jgi:nucleotide-binding universal stress UspA family protein
MLASTTDTRPHDITHDLTRLGEFIVIIAQERAQAAGLTNAHWIVRLGLVREEMISYLQGSGADRLVLGARR